MDNRGLIKPVDRILSNPKSTHDRDKSKMSFLRRLHDIRVIDELFTFASTEVAEGIKGV